MARSHAVRRRGRENWSSRGELARARREGGGARACDARPDRLKSSFMYSTSTSQKNSLPLSEQNQEIQDLRVFASA